MCVGVDHEDLPKDESRKRAEIDRVNAAVDDKIAHHTQKDQNIYASIKHVFRHEEIRETAKTRGSQRACRDQHQPPMELRLCAPINRQRERDDERRHVKQRNDQESITTRRALVQHIEACHGHGRRHTHDRNRSAQPRPELPDLAMHAHITRAHQDGLKNEEQQPSSENSGMKIKDKWSRRRRMKEVLIDGMAESVRHHRGDKQRHGKVKIILQQFNALGRY